MTKRQVLILLPVLGVLTVGTVATTLLRGETKFGYTLYRVEKGWGYDISRDGKTVIHQPFVPALEGNGVFVRKRAARQAARLVIRKLQSGNSPMLLPEEVERILSEQKSP